MAAISSTNGEKINNEKYETTYHSYILRIWKAEKNTFKGYVLDPVTNQTYPMRNISNTPSFIDDAQLDAVLIKPLNCWVGIWKSKNNKKEDKQSEDNFNQSY